MLKTETHPLESVNEVLAKLRDGEVTGRAVLVRLERSEYPASSEQSEAEMQITRNNTETARGPSDWFTGDVYIDTVAAPSNGSRIGAAASTSRRAPAPRGTPTRTARRSGSPRASASASAAAARSRSSAPGDRVFFEPGEDHWHGAAPNRFMTHIAMQQADDEGNVVTWGDHVTDEEYAAASPIDKS